MGQGAPMTSDELREEIAIEFENIETVLDEFGAFYEDVKGRDVSVREKTAAAAFLAQFYSGIENILKRISRFHNIPLPSGEMLYFPVNKIMRRLAGCPLTRPLDDQCKEACPGLAARAMTLFLDTTLPLLIYCLC